MTVLNPNYPRLLSGDTIKALYTLFTVNKSMNYMTTATVFSHQALRKTGGGLTMKTPRSNKKGDKRPFEHDDPTEP